MRSSVVRSARCLPRRSAASSCATRRGRRRMSAYPRPSLHSASIFDGVLHGPEWSLGSFDRAPGRWAVHAASGAGASRRARHPLICFGIACLPAASGRRLMAQPVLPDGNVSRLVASVCGSGGARIRVVGSGVGLKRLARLLLAGTLLCSLVAAATASGSYTSAAIPANLAFTAIASTRPGLVLSGTTTLAGDQGVLCLMARATPRTLALFGLVEPFCDSPLPSGHSIVAVQQPSPRMVTSVRIARLSPTGHIQVGPVVVRYEEASDTHLESVYAAGSLWLYAPDTSSGGGRALRISERTGRVLQDTPVSPAMDRPVIGANANGLYLAPNPETGFLGSAKSPNENGIIYHVGIGASGVQIFDAAPRKQFQGYVSWITGDGNSLWADICYRPAGRRCMITRFNGSSPKPVFQVSDRDLTAFWVIGSVARGFYSVALRGGATTSADDVIRIDPATGAVKVITTLPLPEYWQGAWYGGSTEAALDGRSLYLLSPPA